MTISISDMSSAALVVDYILRIDRIIVRLMRPLFLMLARSVFIFIADVCSLRLPNPG
jgi:hypothetical protein